MGGVGGGGRGDLYVVLQVKPHPIFERHENHLLCELPVSFTQATLGAELEVPTLNGRATLKVPAGTQSGTLFRLRGKGIPDLHGGRRGDELIRVIVETPTGLNQEQQRALREFAKLCGEDTGPLRRSFLEQVKKVFGA